MKRDQTCYSYTPHININNNSKCIVHIGKPQTGETLELKLLYHLQLIHIVSFLAGSADILISQRHAEAKSSLEGFILI